MQGAAVPASAAEHAGCAMALKDGLEHFDM